MFLINVIYVNHPDKRFSARRYHLLIYSVWISDVIAQAACLIVSTFYLHLVIVLYPQLA